MNEAAQPNSASLVKECVAAHDELLRRQMREKGIQPGRIELLGWDIAYVNAMTVAAFIDAGLIRRINDFHADNEAPLILDCGANIGCTVLNYKRQFPRARIVAFEPDPQFAPILRRNLEANGVQGVKVVEAAVWSTDGELRWFSEGADGSHVLAGPAGSEGVRVQGVDLARYLSEPVDLLKLDIEGAEYHVIPHLGERLRNVKNILVECHIDQSTVPGLCRVFESLTGAGFRLGINTYGPWRDLIRQPPVPKDHWEQYALVAGWRDADPRASSDATFFPYLGMPLLKMENAQALRQMVLDLAESRLAGRPQRVRVRELTRPFRHDRGLCWTQTIAELSWGDDLEYPQRSSLFLLEDEKLLGPTHALHDDIRTQGGGGFSHWETTLYFSSSDGTDPNTNGRRYAIMYLDDRAEEA